MPVTPIPRTPAVAQTPEAASREDVRERRWPRDGNEAFNRRRKRSHPTPEDKVRKPADNHIDTMA